MSKNNMLLGYARGKVGDVVFSRLNGQQITRAYNGSPKDRKSEAQVAQRVKLPSLVAFYQRNKSFFPYSFATKKTTWSEYNAFVSANLIAGKTVFYAKGNIDAGYPVVAPFIMSKGNMQSIQTAFAIDSQSTPNHTVVASNILCDPTIATEYNNAFDEVGNADIGILSQLLIAQNDFLQDGDMITFFIVATSKITDNGEINIANLGNANVYFKAQFTLDIASHEKWDGKGLYLCSLAQSGALKPVLGLRDYFGTPTAVKDDPVSMYSMMSANGMGSVCVISRNTSGKVEVGYSEMHVNDPASQYYEKYASAEAMAVAMDSYTYNPDGFLKPRPNF